MIMPILSGLRRQLAEETYEDRFGLGGDAEMDCGDETFVSDVRSGMRPVQIIERKFGVAMSRENGWMDSSACMTRTRFE